MLEGGEVAGIVTHFSCVLPHFPLHSRIFNFFFEFPTLKVLLSVLGRTGKQKIHV